MKRLTEYSIDDMQAVQDGQIVQCEGCELFGWLEDEFTADPQRELCDACHEEILTQLKGPV